MGLAMTGFSVSEVPNLQAYIVVAVCLLIAALSFFELRRLLREMIKFLEEKEQTSVKDKSSTDKDV